MLGSGSNAIIATFGTLANSVLQISLVIILVILFLVFEKEIFYFLSKVVYQKKEKSKQIIVKVKNVMLGYTIGMLIVAFILSICNSIALMLMGIEHAIFFGVFAGILNVVPFVGPLVGSVFPAIFALATKDSSWISFWVIIYFIAIQLIESYLITPNIVGRRVSINPMFTILAIFVGNLIWGVAGMIIFIPITAIVKETFAQLNPLSPYAYIMGDFREERKIKLKKPIFGNRKHKDQPPEDIP